MILACSQVHLRQTLKYESIARPFLKRSESGGQFVKIQ